MATRDELFGEPPPGAKRLICTPQDMDVDDADGKLDWAKLCSIVGWFERDARWNLDHYGVHAKPADDAPIGHCLAWQILEDAKALAECCRAGKTADVAMLAFRLGYTCRRYYRVNDEPLAEREILRQWNIEEGKSNRRDNVRQLYHQLRSKYPRKKRTKTTLVKNIVADTGYSEKAVWGYLNGLL
jgi:hypothetical protein